jgi:hypothetical protein
MSIAAATGEVLELAGVGVGVVEFVAEYTQGIRPF